ncbi:MAG: GNAT family N-acetyltransferase [Ruminococcus sp.]|jgi:predicted GNAT family N-acyltransferase
MNIVIYTSLPEDGAAIRNDVFVKEQGFQKEFDETDRHARHMVLYDHGVPAAVCRFYKSERAGEYIVGRIAVVQSYRGRKLGALILKKAEEEIKKEGGKSVALHAQERAAVFYEKQGYLRYGEPDFDEDCPHIWMRKELNLL